MVAAGLAGPSRAGGRRRCATTCSAPTLLNGRGEVLRFGGQVMKNVAGYDVSRAAGRLAGHAGRDRRGSLKVLPIAPADADAALRDGPGRRARACSTAGAASRCRSTPAPGGTAAWCVRLRGARRRGRRRPRAASAASDRRPTPRRRSGRACATTRDEFFVGRRRRGRAPARRCGACRCRRPRRRWPRRATQLIEWGGAQRWLVHRRAGARGARGRARGRRPRDAVSRRATSRAGAFAPLAPPLARIHRELKNAFDPRRHVQPRPALPGPLTTAPRPIRLPLLSKCRTDLAPEFQDTPDGREAEAILRKCVHCGFCTATCPTYQLLGDELDGPRGRIYLIKQVLEGDAPTRSDAAAPRPLPDLPQLRDHLPVGRAVRRPGRHRPRASSTSRCERPAQRTRACAGC